ncbi:MAG TPA: glycosyltransferase family 2 protein [bacterium]|nr:glycosyltransferase family 2 protein [bacterium]HOL34690.1 glycosyltransferase family 2 protein [bacterium]HPP07552.1 glycosyltransferase family 2 protein [bacterium]
MKISVLIPVYNEQNTITEVLEKIVALPVEKEIIVIDDGSTDGTAKILETLSAKENIHVITQKFNKGKGFAIKTGIKCVSGDYVIIQDADLELNPLDIIKMVEEVKNGAQVVYGSRFLEKRKMPLINLLANKFLTFLTNLLYRSNITDMETCYKLCATDILTGLNLKSERFEIEPEITCKILKKGYKIKEVSVSYNPRKAGKKIGWKDGFKAIFAILKYRFYE